MSDIINQNIPLWRQKAADNTITIDEMKEAISAIRKERMVAGEVSAKSKTKKAAAKEKAAPIDSEAMLEELNNFNLKGV